MDENQPTLKMPPPSGQGVMFYTLDRGGNMTPVSRIEKRADGPWEMFSGRDNAKACLEPLEEAHACCLRVCMAQVAAAAIEGLAARGLKLEGAEADRNRSAAEIDERSEPEGGAQRINVRAPIHEELPAAGEIF